MAFVIFCYNYAADPQISENRSILPNRDYKWGEITYTLETICFVLNVEKTSTIFTVISTKKP